MIFKCFILKPFPQAIKSLNIINHANNTLMIMVTTRVVKIKMVVLISIQNSQLHYGHCNVVQILFPNAQQLYLTPGCQLLELIK